MNVYLRFSSINYVFRFVVIMHKFWFNFSFSLKNVCVGYDSREILRQCPHLRDIMEVSDFTLTNYFQFSCLREAWETFFENSTMLTWNVPLTKYYFSWHEHHSSKKLIRIKHSQLIICLQLQYRLHFCTKCICFRK